MRTTTGASHQPRVPAGVPTGGRWSSALRPEPSGSLNGEEILDSSSPDYHLAVADRRRLLLDDGYAPATSMVTDANINRSWSRRKWWDALSLVAEDGHADGDYPRFDEDTTTLGADGREIGVRRMSYQGAGVQVRMPSAASIRRFSAQCGSPTFDVPVSIVGSDGRTRAAWVRVTRCEDGTWASRALGMGHGAEAAETAEAVSAVVEARRPGRALESAGNLLERRRQKAAAVGVRPKRISSAWVTGLGYDPANKVMVMTTRREVYGYQVERHVYGRLATASSPGATFNEVVKGRAKRVEVVGCAHCGRFHLAGLAHRCPPREAARPGRNGRRAS